MIVIISYRRDDTGAITGRICDRLRARFGAERVYMDIDSNPIGVDYRAHIDDSLKRCDMLLAVIGRQWLGPGAAGSRRIDDPSDLVRLEVASALTRGIRVVPILIDETEMPSAEELPEELRGLKFRQAFRVDSGVDFHHHLDRLCAAIEAASPSAGGATDSAGSIPPRPEPAARQPDETRVTGPRPHESAALPERKGEAEPLTGTERPTGSKLARAALICSIAGPFLVLFQGEGLHLYFQMFISCLFALAGAAVIFGHLARRQLRRNPSLSGGRIALAGLILGYIMLLFATIGTISVIHDLRR
jgi:Domain of unknown function (DUF4190)/TIR domain